MSTGATSVFGSAPWFASFAGLGAAENIFVAVFSSTWTSNPSTGSNISSAASKSISASLAISASLRS